MDILGRWPLVDCFRRGEAPRDVRLEAARGVLAPRAQEQLMLLALLVADADAEVAAAAEATLSALPAASLAAFLAHADIEPEVREFFLRRGIAAAGVAPEGADEPLGDDTLAAGVADGKGDSPPEDAGGDAPEETVRLSVGQRLASLSVAERMKAAMQGSREERTVLIRDPNRLVCSAVLSSPKISESEIEAIARMGNVSDEVLRLLGTNRLWTKSYRVAAALVRNAKTPIAVSLTLLKRLTERDTKMLVMDRNIPELVRLSARRILSKAATRRQ